MAIKKRLHSIGLYFTNLIDVLDPCVLGRGSFSLSTSIRLLRSISVCLLTLRRLAFAHLPGLALQGLPFFLRASLDCRLSRGPSLHQRLRP